MLLKVMKGVRGVITPWAILGGGWINLSVTVRGDPTKGDPGGEPPDPDPHPPSFTGVILAYG
jgi:hypothetical protein